jgi:hypothetical protein
LFVTDHEPIYALALTDPGHPLALDTSSPLHTDFTPEVWNQIYDANNCEAIAKQTNKNTEN